jgi:hypothetical protein
MMRTILTAALAALVPTAFPTPAAALDVSEFYEACFVRAYDGAHLQKHPGQSVSWIRAEIIEWEANPFVRVTYEVRDGARFRFAGDCYDEIDGGYLCHRCKDDSCSTGEETFKLLLRRNDAIVIANDTTGMTAESEDGAVDLLPADDEHGAFALSRTDYSACEE